MKFTILLLAYVFFIFPAKLDTFTREANTFFEKQVAGGMVDYAAIKKNTDQIDQLYRQISDMNLEEASDMEKKAFYINAYNIITIHQVVENYPIKSPQDVKGFFDQKKHKVAGETLTLNVLEKQKLMEPYGDPRVHFVLVCAAVSCPPLSDFAYQADQLDQQLDQKTKQAMNDPQFTRVMDEQKKVEVSKIFDWYKSDFTRNNQSVPSFINQYRDKKIPDSYQVAYYEYNWQLNDQ